MTSSRFRYSIVACARWECAQISEWLAYHRSIGFDHVFLYCNDDEPMELYEAVIPFGADFVTFTHFPFVGQQFHMYRHFLLNHKDATEWFLFLDVDEFLYLANHGDIARFVETIPSDWDSVYFNWLMFGTSGHKERPPGSVLLNYTYRAAPVNPHTKTFTRSASIASERLGPYIHYSIWHHWPTSTFNDLNKRNVLGEPMDPYWKNFAEQAWTYLKEPGINDRLAAAPCIFHYFLKSERDFQRRNDRGAVGEFAGQSGWLRKWQLGEMAGLVAHLGGVHDDRLCSYWRGLLERARGRSILPFMPWPNVAKGKPADQSSICEWSHGASPQEDAARVVAGTPTGQYTMHTGRDREPWWSVDLGGPYRIFEIRIFNRLDHSGAAKRLREVSLAVSDDGQAWTVVQETRGDHVWGGVDGSPLVFSCTEGIVCRHIRVMLMAVEFLNLDQVEAYGAAI